MQELTIEAQPSPVTVRLAQTALVIIDMQKDFLYPGGYGESLGNDVSLLQRAIQPTRRVLEAARGLGLLVVHTREGHLPDLSDCPQTKLLRWPAGRRIGDPGPMGRILVRGEPGHAIIDELAPLPEETVVDKPGKCAFYRTNLDELLRRRGIRSILFAGVTTDVCCSTTISAANDRGYDGIVMGDCMASYDPRRHRSVLEVIKAQGGIFGWVTASRNVLAAFRQGQG
ncbi:MAG TPA: cysteine hydrolase [Dehalococcoidia bacterium]|nr:cysteine hydrolase [Dehalococcoidia bacterium]